MQANICISLWINRWKNVHGGRRAYMCVCLLRHGSKDQQDISLWGMIWFPICVFLHEQLAANLLNKKLDSCSHLINLFQYLFTNSRKRFFLLRLPQVRNYPLETFSHCKIKFHQNPGLNYLVKSLRSRIRVFWGFFKCERDRKDRKHYNANLNMMFLWQITFFQFLLSVLSSCTALPKLQSLAHPDAGLSCPVLFRGHWNNLPLCLCDGTLIREELEPGLPSDTKHLFSQIFRI